MAERDGKRVLPFKFLNVQLRFSKKHLQNPPHFIPSISTISHQTIKNALRYFKRWLLNVKMHRYDGGDPGFYHCSNSVQAE